MTDGRIFHTKWDGTAWGVLLPLGTPRASAYVSDLFVDPANRNLIIATHATIGGGRVFVSTNGSAAWIDRSAGLPGLPVNALAVDPVNPARLWIGLDSGVYESTSGGAEWSDFSNGLPNCFIGDLLYHSQSGLLRAGTRNRGVWQIEV